jgi:hypothetical protein
MISVLVEVQYNLSMSNETKTQSKKSYRFSILTEKISAGYIV